MLVVVLFISVCLVNAQSPVRRGIHKGISYAVMRDGSILTLSKCENCQSLLNGTASGRYRANQCFQWCYRSVTGSSYPEDRYVTGDLR